jgi:hypothetical protein
MARPEFKPNPRVHQIFDDLENYLNFCRDYGYRYDEYSLYDQRNQVYRQYLKFLQGKDVKNNWFEDSK